jgi:mono/diheme cytochrome c family protein
LRRFLQTGLFGLLLLLAGCGLSQEPAIISTRALPTPTTTPVPDRGLPTSIDLANGRRIFMGEQGCVLCHGQNGLGDGPVAAEIACSMPKLADPDAHRGKALLAWFAITSNGNNGGETCPMPAWRGRLSEAERWDVASYAYSLRYSETQLALGGQVWAQTCAACHSEGSEGNLPNFANPALLVNQSDTDLWRFLSEGGDGAVHNFAAKLTEAERWAVVAHLRALAWANPVPLAATEEVAPTPAPTLLAVAPVPDGVFTVRARVEVGTANVSLPINGIIGSLRVVVLAANGPEEIWRSQTEIAADGSFTFNEVPRRDGAFYIVTTTFAQVEQFSPPLQLTGETALNADGGLSLPLTVYETTNDPSVIKIELARFFFDFLNGREVLVQAALRYRNTSDKLYISGQDEAGNRLGYRFALPPNLISAELAEDLAGQYQLRNDSVTAVLPTAPGTAYPLQLSYRIGYDGQALRFALPNQLTDALIISIPEAVPFPDARFDVDEPVRIQAGTYASYALRGGFAPGPNSSPIQITIQPLGGQQASVVWLLLAAAAVIFGLAIFAIIRLDRGQRAA